MSELAQRQEDEKQGRKSLLTKTRSIGLPIVGSGVAQMGRVPPHSYVNTPAHTITVTHTSCIPLPYM
jgi:hypothetical protein